jgi:T5SS/PEP-CTERM-associated repeat protein
MKIQPALLAFILATLTLLLPPAAHAQTTQFTGATSSDWQTGTNWDNGVPTSANPTSINLTADALLSGGTAATANTGGNRTITNPMNFAASEFGQVNLGAVTSGTLRVTGSIDQPAANLIVASSTGRNASLDITGSVSVAGSLIGFGDNSVGIASVTGGTWDNSGVLVVGAFGNGTIEISSGGALTSDGGVLGLTDTGEGTVRVTSGSWVNSSVLGIGESGIGTLEVSGTGSVSSTIAVLGFSDTAMGTATVSGGT